MDSKTKINKNVAIIRTNSRHVFLITNNKLTVVYILVVTAIFSDPLTVIYVH